MNTATKDYIETDILQNLKYIRNARKRIKKDQELIEKYMGRVKRLREKKGGN